MAYSTLEIHRQAESGPSDSYVWDLGNPAQPEATLSATSPLVSLNFNLKDSQVRRSSSSFLGVLFRCMVPPCSQDKYVHV